MVVEADVVRVEHQGRNVCGGWCSVIPNPRDAIGISANIRVHHIPMGNDFVRNILSSIVYRWIYVCWLWFINVKGFRASLELHRCTRTHIRMTVSPSFLFREHSYRCACMCFFLFDFEWVYWNTCGEKYAIIFVWSLERMWERGCKRQGREWENTRTIDM